MARLTPRLADLVPREWDVFVSYAREDAQWADRVIQLLQNHGLRCWRDKENLRLGDEFDERISQAIARSRVFLVLVSRVATTKPYVAHEVSSARALRHRVNPVFLEEVPAEELRAPFDLKGIRIHSRWIRDKESEDDLLQVAKDLRTEAVRNRIHSWISLVVLLVLGVLAVGLTRMVVQHERVLTSLGEQQRQLAREIPIFEPLLKRLASQPTTGVENPPAMEFAAFGQRAGSGSEFVLSDERSLRSGDFYRMEMVPRTSGWLYIFQVDSAGKIQWLYPANTSFSGSSGQNPVQSDMSIKLPPDANTSFGLDDATGTEHLIAVLSATRFEALEERLAQVSQDISRSAQPLSVDNAKAVAALTKGSIGVVKPPGRLHSESGPEGKELIQFLQARGDLLVLYQSFPHVSKEPL